MGCAVPVHAAVPVAGRRVVLEKEAGTRMSKLTTWKNVAIQTQRVGHSSHRLRGAVLALKRLPRVRKVRVAGANVLARLRRAQPEGLHGDWPRVERFVRHPGFYSSQTLAPRRGAGIILLLL